ncbi:MAG: NAD(+)/NADH kinase [Ruminococcus sp.]
MLCAFSGGDTGCGCAVAIGGDGTILHCARHVVGTSAKLLGINTGRLGFLASMEPDQIGEIARLQTGDYRVPSGCCSEARCWTKQGLVSGN